MPTKEAKGFFLIIAFLFFQSIFVRDLCATEKMTFMIIQRSGMPQCDVRKLQAQQDRFLVLITKSEFIDKLQPEERSSFDVILPVEDFSEEAIVRECTRALTMTGSQDPNQVRIATTNEGNTLLLGKVRESLKIPGLHFKDALRFKNKLEMKEKIAEHHIPIPKYVHFQGDAYRTNPHAYVQQLVEYLEFPIFAKPIDEAGSLGTCTIKDLAALTKWCEDHDVLTNYELDEYISGTLYHCDSIIRNGKPIFSQYCQYSCPNAEFLEGKPLGSYILPPTSPGYSALELFNKQALGALSLIPDGAIHLEVFKDQVGNLIFLEIACRPPGGHVPEMYEKVFGFNFHEAHLKAQMGLDNFLPEKSNQAMNAAWMCFPNKKGTVVQLNEPAIKSSYQFSWSVKPGDITGAAEQFLHKVGGCYFWNADFDALLEDFHYLFCDYTPVTYAD